MSNVFKWWLNECEIDNRDETTTEIVLPTGDRLVLTKENCRELVKNMEENNPPQIPDEWIERVRNYARLHYNEDGWDYMIESISDKEIRDDFDAYATYEEFFAQMHGWVKMLDSKRKDIQGEIF
jgi:hypothetical protein